MPRVGNCCRIGVLRYALVVPGRFSSPFLFHLLARLFYEYYTFMASKKKKKGGSGSAQVSSWRFTYEDRIESFVGVESREGNAALLAYGELYARLERKLFACHCSGVPLDRLSTWKKAYQAEYRIPGRMFNALRVSVKGKVLAVRESQLRQIESLERRIERAGKEIAKALERGRLNVAHQKKRRLANLEDRLQALKVDVLAGRARICFGSKKLWRKQYSLEANGYSSHEEWLGDWQTARSDEFFVLGSKDEASGCQLCVATVQDDSKLTLRLRMPDALAGKHGKYLVMERIHFNHGHAQVLAALQGGEGQAISYRFKRDGKGWRVFASVKHQPVAVVTDRRLGALGVDVNVDHLAVSETDFSGNWLRSWTVPLVTYGKSKKQAEALIGDAVAQVVVLAREAGKPLVIEDLDFSKKKDELEGESPGRSRMLSSFAYGKIKAYFLSRGYREGVEVREANPAYSSVIGRVLFTERFGLSVDQAAALVLARRSQGCSERIPRQRGLPAGKCGHGAFAVLSGDGGRFELRVPDGHGGHIDLCVPVRRRAKHVWTQWGVISGRLKKALAERRRQAKCRQGMRGASPVGAGPRAGPGCGQIGVPRVGFPGSRSSRVTGAVELPFAVGAAEQLRLFS